MKYLIIAGLLTAGISISKTPKVSNANVHCFTLKNANQASLDSLKKELIVIASDSTLVDGARKIAYYYGNVQAYYGSTKINAQYVKVDKNNLLLYAKKVFVTSTNNFPNESALQADSIKFDLKTQRLISYMPLSSK